jgi:imidazolonepropionase-like amidohydrolase
LDPALLPKVVEKAHAAGLPISVHVETATDFRAAIEAGADEIAHLPGWLIESESDVERARLSEEDARLAAAKAVVVVTTTVAGRLMPGAGGHHSRGYAHEDQASTVHQDSHEDDGTLQTRAREVQRDNLRLLVRYGVKLAIGSDHADTSLAEAQNLHGMGIFDNLTLLKLWCEATPPAIFPGREIGRFEEGYEASFLVLEGDPLADFTNVQSIRLRVKQGMQLTVPFH